MSGRSKLLKSSYRTDKEHFNIAIKLLQKNEANKKEVEKFYDGGKELNSLNQTQKSIFKLFDGFFQGIDILQELLKNGYKANDILILTTSKKFGENFKKMLPHQIEQEFMFSKDIDEKHGTITTYHSSKGLENKVAILLNFDLIKDEKLLYVAMTRASEKLYIDTKKNLSYFS